jgi:hypothetical protein
MLGGPAKHVIGPDRSRDGLSLIGPEGVDHPAKDLRHQAQGVEISTDAVLIVRRLEPSAQIAGQPLQLPVGADRVAGGDDVAPEGVWQPVNGEMNKQMARRGQGPAPKSPNRRDDQKATRLAVDRVILIQNKLSRGIFEPD